MAAICSIVPRVSLKPLLVAQVLLGPVLVITFQFVALPYRLAGTLASRFCTIILLAVTGGKKRSTIHARDRLHIVSPELNHMNQKNYMDYSILKTELNARN